VGSNRLVVLTALPLEAAAVRALLPRRARHDLPAGTIVEEAALPGTGYNVCLACTGPGNGQAAVVAERVINWAAPAAVLFVGVAGALKDDLALGDVIAATRVVGYQGGKETAAGFKTRPEAWDGTHRLIQVAQYVEANALWVKYLPDGDAHPVPNVHFRPVASGDVVKATDDSPLAVLLDSA
jgi:nucleoside phosphorylase